MTDQVDVGFDGSATSADEFRELKEVLIGPERARLAALERRLDASALNAENLAGHLPEAQANRAALLTLTKKTTKAPKQDSLGHPAGDFDSSPIIHSRWNMSYAGSIDQFKARTEQLRALRPVTEP